VRANNFRYRFASRGDRALYCGDENYPLLWDYNLLYALAAEPFKLRAHFLDFATSSDLPEVFNFLVDDAILVMPP
jgi:hypothetical protein